MARGGARPGAGRKLGSKNKARALRRKAEAGGKMPLDVLLETMRHFDARARKSRDPEEADRLRVLAANAAKQAADYLHPKLSSVEHGGSVGIRHEDALAQLE